MSVKYIKEGVYGSKFFLLQAAICLQLGWESPSQNGLKWLSEHCIFMFVPVDVPCVSRKDHSIANIAESVMTNVYLVGYYFASVIKMLCWS